MRPQKAKKHAGGGLGGAVVQAWPVGIPGLLRDLFVYVFELFKSNPSLTCDLVPSMSSFRKVPGGFGLAKPPFQTAPVELGSTWLNAQLVVT